MIVLHRGRTSAHAPVSGDFEHFVDCEYFLDGRKRRSSFAVCVQNIWLNMGLTIDRKSETLIQVFLTKSSVW